MKKSKYGVLLLGGQRSHQENYARDFANDERCDLVGVTDAPDIPPERREWLHDLARDLEIPVLPDVDAALARRDVHIACVCVEFERRAQIATRCALAGKHVYVDKPIGTTNEAATALVGAVKRQRVKSHMFTMLRQGWMAQAKAIAVSGRLGELTSMHCDLLFPKGPAGTADLTSARRESFPPQRFTFVEAKRELFTTCVYSIALLRSIHRQPIRQVYATTSNYFFREHQARDVEDFCALTLTFADGLTATITGGRTGWLSYPGFGPMRIFLCGSNGSALVDAAEPRLEVQSDTPSWQPPEPNPDDPMGFWSSTTRAWGAVEKTAWRGVGAGGASDASYFVDCIESDRDSDVDAAEGALNLRVLLAAYESAAKGAPVSLQT